MALNGNHSGTAIIREGLSGTTGLRRTKRHTLKFWQCRLFFRNSYEKVSHFLASDYHLCALCLPEPGLAQRQGCNCGKFTICCRKLFCLHYRGERSWPKDSNAKPKKRRNPRSSRYPPSNRISVTVIPV